VPTMNLHVVQAPVMNKNSADYPTLSIHSTLFGALFAYAACICCHVAQLSGLQ
jgi:hypothetical protein